MTFHKITTVSSVLAALALAATPALAQTVNLGNTSVSADANLGGSGGTTADVDVNTGALGGDSGGTSATGDLSTGALGGSSGTTADVDLNTGAIGGDSSTSVTFDLSTGEVSGIGETTGSLDIGTGANGGTTASLNLGTGLSDLNGDGVIDTVDQQLTALDLNGDGVLDAADDLNNDGVLNLVDIRLGGEVSAATASGAAIGEADVIGQLAALPDSALRGALSNLDDSEIFTLKRTCEEVLGSPATYSGETVAVCEVIASI